MKRVDNKCWNHGCGILTAMFNELDGFWEGWFRTSTVSKWKFILRNVYKAGSSNLLEIV